MEEWNPMQEASESFRNTMSFSIVEDYRKPQDIPCPFQRESNKPCFKGRMCPHKHGKYTPEIIHEHPKLSERLDTCSIVVAEGLPIKRILTDSFITVAWVNMVVDPSEFYVVTKGNRSCLCGDEPNDDAEFGSKRTSAGFEELNILWKNMQKHYCIVNDQPMQYLASELVAVKLSLADNKASSWFRAVVLEDTDNDLDADKAPCVDLKLLDFGLKITKTTLDMAPLHEKFVIDDPPMAYKCSLYGISPMLGKWGKDATGLFKTLVSGQIVILEVKGRAESFDIFEESSMSVTIYVKHQNKLMNVTKYLGDLALGIEWNPFPTRPFVNELLSDKNYDYLIKNIKTDEDQDLLIKETEEILERENKRLKCFINQCSKE